MRKQKVGILGFGAVGQFLFDKITNDKILSKKYEIAFIWNRSKEKYEQSGFKNLEQYILPGENLVDSFFNTIMQYDEGLDILIEVAHPSIVETLANMALECCSFMPTSLTAFADEDFKKMMFKKADSSGQKHGLYLPTGAAWGINDIQKMAKDKSLTALEITMKFGTSALKLNSPLKEKLIDYEQSDNQNEMLLFSGSVKELAQLAPNNVNTMCCLALAAGNLGMENVKGNLFAKKVGEEHIVKIEATGKDGFKVNTERINPAKKGAVTGKATYDSFLNSLLSIDNKKGVWFV